MVGGVLMSASAAEPGAGTYRLVNTASDTCPEVPAGSTDAGVQLALADCDGDAGQSWELADPGDGEDAASFKGKSASAAYVVDGGGARKADDEVFQHNGAGTLTIRNFQVSDFGKLYRSCGNCGTRYERHVVIDDVLATDPGKVIAGVNSNHGDTATLSDVTIVGDGKKKMVVCERFKGNDSGDEPTAPGSGPDGTSCLYGTSEVTYR